jgi:hypothetical protein
MTEIDRYNMAVADKEADFSMGAMMPWGDRAYYVHVKYNPIPVAFEMFGTREKYDIVACLVYENESPEINSILKFHTDYIPDYFKDRIEDELIQRQVPEVRPQRPVNL